MFLKTPKSPSLTKEQFAVLKTGKRRKLPECIDSNSPLSLEATIQLINDGLLDGQIDEAEDVVVLDPTITILGQECLAEEISRKQYPFYLIWGIILFLVIGLLAYCLQQYISVTINK